jgi:hypothetical protein
MCTFSILGYWSVEHSEYAHWAAEPTVDVSSATVDLRLTNGFLTVKVVKTELIRCSRLCTWCVALAVLQVLAIAK